MSSRVPLEDLGEIFGIDIESEEVDTVGGLLGYELGRVPLPGSEVTTHGLLLRGEGGADPKGRVRITTVLVEKLEPDEESTEDDDSSDVTHQH